MTDPIKLGALAWNQYTTWEDLREAGIRADRLGYDSIWTCDQVQSAARSATRFVVRSRERH